MPARVSLAFEYDHQHRGSSLEPPENCMFSFGYTDWASLRAMPPTLGVRVNASFMEGYKRETTCKRIPDDAHREPASAGRAA